MYLVHLILRSLLFQGVPLPLRSVTTVTLFPQPYMHALSQRQGPVTLLWLVLPLENYTSCLIRQE